MTKRSSGLAGAFVLLAAAAGAWSCSSAETPEPSDGTGATAGSSGSGGSTPGTGGSTPGTGGAAPGTGGATAGTGGATPGTGGTTGGACVVTGTPVPPPVAPAECRGIRTNMACPTEGVSCMGLACGLADTGRRDCSCTGGLWSCTSCDLSMSPFLTRPECTPVCGIQADAQPCSEQGAVCDNAAGGEACACWPDDESVLIWDCDRPPWGSGT